MMAEFVADIGNSGIKLCSTRPRSKPEITRFAGAPAACCWLKSRGAAFVLIGSVNGPLEKTFVRLLKKHGISFRLAGKTHLGGLVSDYDLKQIGPDRLANIVAARKRYKAKNLIVLDSGTALTVDVIEGNRFTGGFILPGLQTMLTALHDRTDLLPRLKARTLKPSIGRNTAQAMMSGCSILFDGGVLAVLDFIRKKRKKRYTLILTGGGPIPKRLPFPSVRDPLLTFIGIRELSCR